jgi:hypothetical protein
VRDGFSGGLTARDLKTSPSGNEVILTLTEQQVELLENLRSQHESDASLEDLILSLLDGYRQSLSED